MFSLVYKYVFPKKILWNKCKLKDYFENSFEMGQDSGSTENGSLYCNTNYLNPSVREKIYFYIKIVKDGHTKIK